jgi:hypothetical protein
MVQDYLEVDSPRLSSSCQTEAPGWASGRALVVHTEIGDVPVELAATPGALACLYYAYCAHCRRPTQARSGCHPRAGPALGSRRPGNGCLLAKQLA